MQVMQARLNVPCTNVPPWRSCMAASVAYTSDTRDSPQTAFMYVIIAMCCTEKELILILNNIARLSWLILLKRSNFYFECLFISSVAIAYNYIYNTVLAPTHPWQDLYDHIK